jgi:hypothetical protein
MTPPQERGRVSQKGMAEIAAACGMSGFKKKYTAKKLLDKEHLQKLHPSPFEYAVIFSGRKSSSVNGCYKSKAGKEPEIILHNKNFLSKDL